MWRRGDVRGLLALAEGARKLLSRTIAKSTVVANIHQRVQYI